MQEIVEPLVPINARVKTLQRALMGGGGGVPPECGGIAKLWEHGSITITCSEAQPHKKYKEDENSFPYYHLTIYDLEININFKARTARTQYSIHSRDRFSRKFIIKHQQWKIETKSLVLGWRFWEKERGYAFNILILLHIIICVSF